MYKDDIDNNLIKKYSKIKTIKSKKLSLYSIFKDIIFSDIFNNYCKIKNLKNADKLILNYTPNESIISEFKTLQNNMDSIYNEENEINLKRKDHIKSEIKKTQSPNNMFERLGVDTISIHVGEELIKIVDPFAQGLLLPNINSLRIYLTDELGYIIPNVRIMDDTKLSNYEYQIFIRSKFVFSGQLTKEDVENNNSDKIIRNLGKICIKYSKQIFTKTDVLKLMELVKCQDPTLVNDLIPYLISPVDLKIILSNLIHDGFSIRDIIFIFEHLNNYARYTQNTDILTCLLKKELSF